MPFKKADPQQKFLKMGVYGPPGSGKTFTTLQYAEKLAEVTGKRIAFVDTERGTDFYVHKNKARAVHPEAFDFDSVEDAQNLRFSEGKWFVYHPISAGVGRDDG